MKINLTKKQYKDLIIMSGLANGVLGILGDSMPDTDYKKKSDSMNELEEYFLQYAKDFDCGEFVEEFIGKHVFEEKAYEKHIMSIIFDYDEGQLISNLANKLAWRDFREEHSDKEMEKMRRENVGYFGVALYDYEKKYWDDFEEYGFDRLRINTDK